MQERSALYALLAEATTDIIIKTDCHGYVLDASPGVGRLGLILPTMLIGPHLRDLVHPAFGDLIARELSATMGGRSSRGWIELPLIDASGEHHWCEVRLNRLVGPGREAYGALVLMRSIAARKTLEDRLFAARHTDPLTRLTNRIAFVAMLDHMVASTGCGCIALFDLDRFLALNLRYGPSAGDDLIRATADLLRAMTRPDDILSRIDGERFAVLMPGLTVAQAAAACEPIVETYAAAGAPSMGDDFPVTVSAGISPIARSTDHTLKRAEIALFMAKAKGRSRVETGSDEWPHSIARCA